MAPINVHLFARAPEGCPSTITGGGIAGIVIGSIAGTLLLLWLWRLCRLPGASPFGSSVDRAQTVPVASSRSRSRRRRSNGSTVEYVEKPRRYRDDVRRPARVYVN